MRTSARKARLVCDHIRGKSVDEARAILALHARAPWRATGASCSSRRSPTPSTTTSCVGDDLRVAEAYADEGPTLKRFRPRAMGRATRIRKRTSHLTITLTPKDASAKQNGSEEFIPSRCAWATSTTGSRTGSTRALRRLPGRGRPHPRAHHRQARARRPVGHHDPQGRQRGRDQHPHGAAGHRDRQVRVARSTRCAATCTG